MSLDKWIRGHARFQPHKAAIRFAGEELSYAALNDAIETAAAVLSGRLRLQPGDRIAVLALNHPDTFVVLLAAAKIGVVVVPLNWRLAVQELLYVVRDCRPKVMLHDADFAETATGLAGQIDAQCVSVDSDSTATRSFSRLRQEALLPGPAGGNLPTPPVCEDDPYLLVYTSGTTGQPKGVLLSQKAVLCNALMCQHAVDLTSADRVLNVLPLFHVGGINIQPLPALLFGATLSLHARFDPVATIEAIESQQITSMTLVPTALQSMVDSPIWTSANLTSLKTIVIGSTDVPVQLIEQVHTRGIPVIQVYGATETGPIAIYQRIEQAMTSVGSIGRAGLLCEIRLTHADGDDVEQGQEGEIRVKGCNVLSSYWHDPQATRENIVDGWFRTGDVARCDKSGNYWFVDRLKHVIISGGENIYAAEVERVLLDVTGVLAVAVVGKPHDRWGEVPVAVVVVDSNGPDEASLLAACDGAIARYKRPREVHFVEALPRNAMGKVVVEAVRKLVGIE